MNTKFVLKLAHKFEKYAINRVWQSGKDYILQKEDGTLIVDGTLLDRDALNAMTSWQDMVDMGVSKNVVGQIAREYGGHPKNVDVWLEQNSKPYTEKQDKDLLDKVVSSLQELFERVKQGANAMGGWDEVAYIPELNGYIYMESHHDYHDEDDYPLDDSSEELFILGVGFLNKDQFQKMEKAQQGKTKFPKFDLLEMHVPWEERDKFQPKFKDVANVLLGQANE